MQIKGLICLICKQRTKHIDHFLLDCETFKVNFSSMWYNLNVKIFRSNLVEEVPVCNFINNLNIDQKKLLLLGGFNLPFYLPGDRIIKTF